MAFPIPSPAMGQSSRALAEAFSALETAVPGDAGNLPGLIVAMNPAWLNKYQLLLYATAADRRYAVVGANTPDDLEPISWPGPVLLHAHWFMLIFRNAQNEAEAFDRLHKACDQILEFRERTGARLLWTAHNIFPHGNDFPAAFLALRRWIFENFDAIHVMDEGHIPVLEKAFGLQAPQSFAVPHMTYCGTVLDSISPATARTHFKLPRDAFVFGFFGSIQKYKKIDLLLDCLEKLQASQPRRVMALIGGIPSDTKTARRLDMRWGDHPNVRLELHRILDHEIQYLHHASDVMVLPYAENLNSGAAFMAATFRKPLLMPRSPATAQLGRAGVTLFDSTEPDGLLKAMAACLDGVEAEFNAETLERFKPKTVSTAFFDAVDALCRPE